MELTYAELSSAGPVRDINEDCVGFWQPDTLDEKRARGAVAILADGVGGLGRGEVASRLAVETVLKTFREADAAGTPQQLLTAAINAANVAVYDKAMEDHGKSPLATTLAAVVLRNNEAIVANVGDSRVYLLRKGEIKQLSTDHSYVGMQRKFGLISEAEAKTSEHRTILTRSVGQEPTIRVDVEVATLFKGDRLVLCSDGLHGSVTDSEICDVIGRNSPAQACRQLVALAEQRGTDDNVSVQVIQIEEVEAVTYYRGVADYRKPAAQPVNEVQPGQTLDDRFFITEIISRSGMATIFKAQDAQNQHQPVAIKVPHLQFESDPGFFGRFQREEEIGSKLKHPFLLRFVPVANKSRPYIVTEYLRGYTLAHLLNNVRPLPERDALKLASRLCEALAYMHQQGVVHRDLKPQNIMICSDGTIRVMDFGIAKSSQSRRSTFTGFTPALGTPDYMAPEQVKGKRGDERTDVYSLGAMLYEMTTGAPPFEGENALVIMNARLTGDPVAPRKVNPKISPAVEEIILHAMAREPAARYPTAAAMQAELDNPASVALTGRADRLEQPKAWTTGWRAYRGLIFALAVPILLVLLVVLWLIVHGPAKH